jgi:hypothetical protein
LDAGFLFLVAATMVESSFDILHPVAVDPEILTAESAHLRGLAPRLLGRRFVE